MPSISADLRFFGLDLRGVWREVRQPWLRMHEWPVLAWLTPSAPVRLLREDGSDACWLGDVRRSTAPQGKLAPRLNAVELPDDLVLQRSLRLPPMAPADTAQAVKLQAHGLSPFPAEDLVWGYRLLSPQAGVHEAQIALASRKQVAQVLDRAAPRLPEGTVPEVWVCPDDGPPIVMAGYGEGARGADVMRQRRVGYALLVCAALGLLAIALTPTLQLWMRGTQAAQAHAAFVPTVRPALAQREALLQSVERLNALSTQLADRIDPLRVLDALTRALPDDSALQSLRVQGQTVTISGLTGNAATLMQLLSDQPGLRDVRAPSPATRQAGATSEAFTIAFALDPKVFGIGRNTAAAPDAAASAAAGSVATAPKVAVSAAVAATSAPAPVASAASASASAPPAPSVARGEKRVADPVPKPTTGGEASPASRPTFGGRAPAFGGGAPARPASAPGAGTP